jgi:hypothetical protein
MTAATPFVAQLRARPGTIRLGTPDEPVITVRVQVPEVWDTVRIDAPNHTPVATVRDRAIAALLDGAPADPADYVVKLRGVEVLDESLSLADAGAENGSTLLVTSRRRRPVR